jgi:hypothetical protein
MLEFKKRLKDWNTGDTRKEREKSGVFNEEIREGLHGGVGGGVCGGSHAVSIPYIHIHTYPQLLFHT